MQSEPELTKKEFQEMLTNGNIRDAWHLKQADQYIKEYYNEKATLLNFRYKNSRISTPPLG